MAIGLYDPAYEHDACGVGMVADLHGRPDHDIVDRGLTVLERLAHRGASGAEVETGDGAGILVQVPHRFLSAAALEAGFTLPDAGGYAVGLAFLPTDPDDALKARTVVEQIAVEERLAVLGWRTVPTEPAGLGKTALGAMPLIEQVFLAPAIPGMDTMALERRAFVLRKRAEHAVDGLYFPSLSARTIVYKGMLTSEQLREFFTDLRDPRFESGLTLVHSRFSTNTFPSWPLAHPYRYLAHNGEINTLAGNRNWMRAREALLETALIDGDLSRIFPICTPGASDSASFDEVLELLHLGGRPLPHAVLMMIPEAWENHTTMDRDRRAFYRYHASLMEPWDGPAAVCFTDGTLVGAVLDRNGLRPARYWVTDDGLVVLASEVGVLDIAPERVVRKGRLQPGRMFLVDTAKGRLVEDEEIKSELAAEHPYGEWLAADQIRLDELPARTMLTPQHGSVVTQQRLFGWTTEESRVILAPMARTGAEPIGSMGSDTSIAVLSDRSRLLYDYFTQLFAQVTNPPLDAIREELVTSLAATIGPEANLLEASQGSCGQILLPLPVIDRDDLAKLMYVNEHGETPGFKAFAIDGLFDVREAGQAGTPTAAGGEALRRAIEEVRQRVSAAIAEGANIIVLSDRNSTADWAPIPSLLLTAAVHHHLVREKTRTKVGLVVETGDAREVHHMALLIGYGAAAVNPYLALDAIDDMISEGLLEGVSPRQARRNYMKAACKGVLKVMSKMGISTVASYTGAQVFEAIGLDAALIDEYFTGTASRIGGVGLSVLAAEVATRHRQAYEPRPTERAHRELEVGGEYQWRREGEFHLFNPKTVFKLRHATRSKRYEIFKEYSSAVDDQAEKLGTLRGLMRLKPAPSGPIPLEEVEPISSIMARFSTGAMSYGSISAESHETLAIAMNRIGGRSNTGEGGEDADRFTPDENGDLRRSAIKQVASGRFGVTSEYLVNADDLQIKISQGAKPGEGGQLAGIKIYPWIARTRKSTPGVGLISPPPHHDIYSIEDIAQLIHDLKSSNPRARVHVKLVAEVGVGTVAAGVAKAHSDVVLISGHDGGTGAAPLTSLKHAGIPWEIGLAETQQTLLANGLRDRIVVQVDGQLKTGRDVVIGALLGAEEYGFASAPLVVSGCIMMRVCHLDTCPVGIATQNPRAAGQVQREARVRRDVLRVRRRGGPRAARLARPALAGRGHRAGRPARDRGGGDALEGGGARPVHGSRPARRPRHGRPAPDPPAGPRPGEGAGPRLHGRLRARAGRRDAGVGPAADHQRGPHGGDAARFRDQPALRRGRVARRHDLADLHRIGRPELRRLRAQGRDDAPVRRRQRLLRQGPVGRTTRGAAAGGLAVHRRGGDHRGQRDPLRRHRRRGLHPRAGGGALLRPQLGGDRGRRGGGRPRLRVHDRWGGAGARADRAQLRGGHVGRDRLRVRPGAHVRAAGQPRAGRRGAARSRGQLHGAHAGRAPRGGDRVGRRRRACWRSGTPRSSSS